MQSKLYTCIIFIVGVEVLIALFVLLHLGGIVWEFGPLTGALISGALILFCATYSARRHESVEPWFAHEKTGWIFIGCGALLWGFGECIWRYYVLKGQNTFPSLADIGYASLPPLMFIGLLLQPSVETSYKKIFIVLDCLIVMGSLLSIAWYLLLGSLVQASTENLLAKLLGLYYPLTDIGLLSSVVFLLMRRQERLYLITARRVALIVLGAGLCLFAVSDFIFNIQQNAGTYVEGKWIDLGWPLGLLTIAMAASFRRFLPRTDEKVLEQRFQHRLTTTFGLAQFATYIALAVLLLVLIINVLSTSQPQAAIRPVLLIATIAVIVIVIIRQILTTIDNQRLTSKQAEALEKLATANSYIETQAQMIKQHNSDLEAGIAHLKNVQASLANGNLAARATLYNNELLPLAASLNLMADRLKRLGQADAYALQLIRFIDELSATIEQYKQDTPLFLPMPGSSLPQMKRLIQALNKRTIDTLAASSTPFTSSATPPLPPRTSPSTPSPYPQSSPSLTGHPSDQLPDFNESSPPRSSTSTALPDYSLPSLPRTPLHAQRLARPRPDSSRPAFPQPAEDAEAQSFGRPLAAPEGPRQNRSGTMERHSNQ